MKFREVPLAALCDGVRRGDAGWRGGGVSADPVGHLASQGSDPDLPSYIAQTLYCSHQRSRRQQTISMQTQSRGGYFPHLSSTEQMLQSCQMETVLLPFYHVAETVDILIVDMPM